MSGLKILITGGSGTLGQYLNLHLSKYFTILTLYNSNAGNCADYNSRKVDLTDLQLLQKVFDDYQPDVVVHTAAIASPILAETANAAFVYDVNVTATKNLADLCGASNAKIIYTSTDLVYAGYRGMMLGENSKLVPISFYAETKLMGEEKIKSSADNFIILRTALLYGFGMNHSQTHFQQMYENLKHGKEVKLYTDQYRTPLELNDAARMIGELIKKNIKSEIINFGGSQRVSRFQLGELLCDIAGLDKSLLIASRMSDLQNYPAVEDVSMNISKLNSCGIFPSTIEESIRTSLENNNF